MKVVCFDLDDTLSKEIVYLKSAYKEIVSFVIRYYNVTRKPVSGLSINGYEVMLQAYRNGENAFMKLNEFLGLDLPVSECLNIYRNHKPKIRLSDDVTTFLFELKASGHVLGLITDGRSIQQRNKIEALELNRFFAEEDIVISEEFGSKKPSEANYTYFMRRYPHAEQYVYVGDNPRKDFLAPNHLGWLTIGLLDDGQNIHKQSMVLSEEFLPQKWINELRLCLDGAT